ncbi:MAG: YDG domain-containing protein [Bacteroidota bacterium]
MIMISKAGYCIALATATSIFSKTLFVFKSIKQRALPLFVGLVLTLFMGTSADAQTQFWSDTFEDTGAPSAGTRTPSTNTGFPSVPYAYYFMRTDGTNLNLQAPFPGDTFTTYQNAQGSKFWAGEDTDRARTGVADANDKVQQIEWTGINISGKSGLSFKGLFAANRNQAWQNPTFGVTYDFLIVEYKIDAGAWTRAGGFNGDASATNAGYLREDTDANNFGDGTYLSKTFQEFSWAIAGTGTTLSLRFRVSADAAAAQEFAIDNFRLLNSGTSGPAATAGNVEYFEGASANSQTFTNAATALNFTLTNKFFIQNVAGYGVQSANPPTTPATGSNFYIDNFANQATNQVNSIKTTNKGLFAVKSLWAYPSSITDGGQPTNNGTLTFTGKKNGATVYTFTKSGIFQAAVNLGANYNGFSYVDFSVGTDNSNTLIDELEISLGSTYKYLALDNFAFTATPSIVNASASAITGTTATLNSSINPSNAATSAISFDYGTSSTLASASNIVASPATLSASTSATAVSANIIGLAAGTTYYYRAKATNTIGTNDNSAILSFTTTATPAPSITAQPSSSTICALGSTTFSITATNATSYQWQVNNGSGFSNVPNAAPYSGVTTSTLTITSAAAALTAYQYRCVATGSTSPAATSNAVTLTVNAAPSITGQPSNSSIVAGATTTFSATVSNATGYQWQVDNGGGFANVPNSAPYSGVTTSTLTITGATVGISGYQYRVVASGSCTPTATSTARTLTVTPAGVLLSTSPTLHFANSTGFADNIAEDGEGGSTAISDINIQTYPINSSAVKITGSPLTYYDNNSPGWPGYPGIISYGDANSFYGWVIKSNDGSNFSLASLNFLDWGNFNGATFKIEAFDGGSSKGSLSFAGNTTAVFKALSQTSGVPALLLPVAFGNVDEVRIYQADGGNSYIALNDVKVSTAVAGPPAPAITSQPSNSSICSGSSTTFSITASNANSYQWYVSTDGGGNFNALSNGAPYSGVGSSTLTITSATATLNAYQYRCVATGTTSPTVTSNAATLTVKAVPVAIATPASATIISGGTTNIALTSTPTGASFAWTAATSSGTVNGATAGSGTSIAQTLTGNGTVTYTVIPTLNSCTGSPITVAITVSPQTSVTSINRVTAATTNATAVDYTVTFSTAVTGVDASDFTLTNTGSVSGTIGTPTGSGTTWTVPVSSITGNGTMRLDFTSITGVTPNTAATYTSGQVYTFDRTAAALTSGSWSSNNANTSYANVGNTVTLAIGFNEDIQMPIIVIAGHTVTPVVGASNRNWTATYTLTASDTEGNIPWTIDHTDIAGNTGAQLTHTQFGLVLPFDKTPPAITISAPSVAMATPGSNVSYTVSYTDSNFNNSTLSQSDITVNATGTASYSSLAITGSSPNYTVTLNGVSGLGTLGISIAASTASDMSGNIAGAAGPSATTNLASNNANLSALVTSATGLSPIFAQATLAYTASVPNATTSTSVTPTLADAGATVQVRINSGTYTTVTSGSPLAGLALNVGNNPIDITVTAQDGTTTKTYTITVARAAAPLISTSGTLTAMSTPYHTPSASQSFNVSGTTMLADVLVTAPSGFEVSSNNINFSNTINIGSVGDFTSLPVYVRLSATAPAGTYSGNISLTSASAITKTVSTVSSTVSPKAITLTLNPSPAITKEYNALTSANLATGNYTLTGVDGSDAVTVSGTASYDTKTIGTGKMVTANTFVLAGADAANYALSTTTATTTGAITAKTITLALNAVPAITKIYNASTTASLPSGNYTLTGVIGLDAVTVSGTAAYDNVNIGTGKIISVNTFVLAGADAGNYTLSTTSATTTGAITAKVLTLALNAVPAIAKTYDGLTTASLASGNYTLTGIVGAESVTVTGSASYDTKTVGTGKTVIANTFVLAGADAGNYTLSTTTATTTGTITTKAITLVLNALPAITKIYNASTTASLVPSNYTLTGVIGLDAVTVSGTAAYDNVNIGTGKTVTANAFVLAGADAANYSLTTTSATTTGAITAKTLTLALNAAPLITKTYDGLTTASLVASNYTLTGIVGAETVTVTGTESYDTKTVGTGKTITANTFVLAGADAGNYNLTTTTATTTGAITAKALTLALNAAPAITKTYNASTAAILVPSNYTLTGVIGLDAVTVSGTAAYDNKTVGTGKTITANAFVLAGADAGNYSLTTTSATTTGTITAKTLTLALNSVPAITKIYNASTAATLASGNYTLTGVVGLDVVNVNGTAVYDNMNIGTGKTITANAFVLAGADAVNYSLTTTSATTTGTITAKVLTLALNAVPLITKTYDGLTTASLATGNYTLTGIVGAETVTVTGTANYDTKAVGTGKTVTANTFVLAGADAGNYTLSTTTATTTGTITTKAITLVLNALPAITKIYNASTTASLVPSNYTLTGVIGLDAVTVSGTAAYDNVNIGTGKTVTANAFVLAGADAANYSLTTTSATTTGAITAKTLTLALNAAPLITKTYDGLTTASLVASNYTLTGIVGAETVTVTGTTSYDTKTVGTGKTVTANTFVLAGADAANYSLTTTTATTTGAITAKALTLALNAVPAITKTYNGSTAASLVAGNYTLTGVVGLDVVNVSGTAVYDNINIGTGKTVTANAFVLAGADAANYMLSTTSATTTGAITAKTLTLALNAAPLITKTYDGLTTASLATGNYTLTGVVGLDVVNVNGTANYDTKLIGTGKTITVNAFVLSGADATNYMLSTTSATTTGAITAKALTLALNALPAISKTYDGLTTATLATGNYMLSGVVGSDVVSVTGTASYDTKTAGTGKIVTANAFVLAGADVGNYTLSTTSVTTTGTIIQKIIGVTALAKAKIYGALDPALTYTFTPALISGDTFTGGLTRNTGENVGSYTINQGTLALNGNYQIVFTAANLSISKRDITVIIEPITKVYGNPDPALVYGTSEPLPFGDTFTGSLVRVSGENVGEYAINLGTLTLNSNYNLVYAMAGFTITPKAIVVNADAKSKTYGDIDPQLTYSVNPGLVSGDSLSGSLTRAIGENAGNYVISRGTLSGSTNYTITFAGNRLNIAQKALVIKADDKVKGLGDNNPLLTASYTGFITGETSAVLTTQPVLTTTALTNSPKGIYPISVGGAAAANYTITHQDGNLTIVDAVTTDVVVTSSPVYEGIAIGTGFGQLRSVSNNQNATFTYSLVTGVGSTDNGLFTISGNVVQVASALDYETKANYSIRVRSTDQNGLVFEKVLAINLIDVNEAPTINVIADRAICFNTNDQVINLTGISAGPETNQTPTLVVASSNPALFTSLTITKGAGTLGTLNYKLAPGAVGTVQISVIVNDNGGVNFGGVETTIQRFTLTINTAPLVNISSDKGTTLFNGETVVLTATGGTTYSWANASGIVSGQNTAILTVKPTETTTYSVTATNASGCSETKTITITVTNLPTEEGAKAKATNIMSPNGDGINDTWVIENIELYPNNSVRIVDRAGRLVYSKKNYDNSWDAQLRGVPLAEGTYYYIIDFGDGKTIKKGFITILRKQ